MEAILTWLVPLVSWVSTATCRVDGRCRLVHGVGWLASPDRPGADREAVPDMAHLTELLCTSPMECIHARRVRRRAREFGAGPIAIFQERCGIICAGRARVVIKLALRVRAIRT